MKRTGITELTRLLESVLEGIAALERFGFERVIRCGDGVVAIVFVRPDDALAGRDLDCARIELHVLDCHVMAGGLFGVVHAESEQAQQDQQQILPHRELP